MVNTPSYSHGVAPVICTTWPTEKPAVAVMLPEALLDGALAIV